MTRHDEESKRAEAPGRNRATVRTDSPGVGRRRAAEHLRTLGAHLTKLRRGIIRMPRLMSDRPEDERPVACAPGTLILFSRFSPADPPEAA